MLECPYLAHPLIWIGVQLNIHVADWLDLYSRLQYNKLPR